jgi:spermidine/putrescine transport system substrate-binding protein
MERRELLRLAGVTLGAAALGRVAGGCTGEPGARTRSGLEPELRLLAPRGAIDAGTLEQFGRETGVRVTHEHYDGPAATLPPDDAGIDLLGFSGSVAGRLAAAGRITPMDRSLVPAARNLLPLFQAEGADLVAVPYAWEATGIAWRPAALPDVPGASPTTWCVFFEPALAGRMTMLDDPREVLGAMLLLRGQSVNTPDASLLQQARDDAQACRRFLAGYRARGATPPMPDGTVVAQARSGDAARAMAGDPGIAFGIPREGGPLFAEQVAIAAAAPHPRAAHAFIDYILRPGTSARLAAQSRRYSPLAGAGSPLPLERLEPVRDVGEAAALYDRHWMEIRSA